MANYYSAPPSSNGVPVFTVPAQPATSVQAPVLPPTYSMAVTPKSSECDCSFNKNNAIWLSSMLIAAGVLGIIGTAIGLYSFAELAEIGTGIWCGLMFLSTGFVGLAAGHFKTIHLVKATVATAAVTLVFTVPLLTISILGLGGGGNCWQFCYQNNYCSCYHWDELAVVANGILIASASGAALFSFWLLIISAISLRSMTKSSRSNLTNLTIVTSPQLQQVVGSNLQQQQQQQPIVIFSNHNQPTMFLGQEMPRGVTSQAQPFVIMGQQPIVMQGTQQPQPQQQQPQQQPFVVFRQEGAPVQSPPPRVAFESPAAQNPAANGQQGHRRNKSGDGDETGVNM